MIGRQTTALAAALLVCGSTVGLAGVSAAATIRPTLRAHDRALAQRESAVALELYALESRVARARASVVLLRRQAAAVAQRRELVRRRSAVVHSSLGTARRRLARALRAVYMQGQPDAVAIFLGAGSIDQALDGLDGLRRAVRANRRLIEDLHLKEVRARRVDVQLRARTRELGVARARAEQGLDSLEAAAGSTRSTLVSLRRQRDLTGQQITRLDLFARQAQSRSLKLAADARRAAVAAAAVQADVPRAIPTALHTAGGTRTLVVDAVAYHLPGKTASGLPVGQGVVAVDPTVIPLGTRLLVPGYGPAVAADVGSAVKGPIIDVWMPSRAKALAWGRRTITITVYG